MLAGIVLTTDVIIVNHISNELKFNIFNSIGCDDIIRQHKAACLRVTSMLVCRDLLWVGTSAGVILTIPTPHLTATSSRLSSTPIVTGKSLHSISNHQYSISQY
jgi:hypothetical protein